MIAYRLLTGKDDAAFCHKVTQALNTGWRLHGSASVTFNAATGETVCAQAVIKDVHDQTYSSDMKLGAL